MRESHESLSSTHAALVSTSSGHAEEITALQTKLEETNAAHTKAMQDVDGELSGRVHQLSEELDGLKKERDTALHEKEKVFEDLSSAEKARKDA